MQKENYLWIAPKFNLFNILNFLVARQDLLQIFSREVDADLSVMGYGYDSAFFGNNDDYRIRFF